MIDQMAVGIIIFLGTGYHYDLPFFVQCAFFDIAKFIKILIHYCANIRLWSYSVYEMPYISTIKMYCFTIAVVI